MQSLPHDVDHGLLAANEGRGEEEAKAVNPAYAGCWLCQEFPRAAQWTCQHPDVRHGDGDRMLWKEGELTVPEWCPAFSDRAATQQHPDQPEQSPPTPALE